ncbi:DUF3302 domain-containing protein [Rhodopirellula sallentina]|uniref:Inner membrane family protein n=1 Tax=Rhodopirellula sallentina SM41 TaxID=1263870 RepID=M5TY48_9BACT|nr:DUF3302 domain-containing protein [Rhodopirellula sallentina]EMI53954.1 inner membrane family protein [Rhodopirellula sallentina SM41]
MYDGATYFAWLVLAILFFTAVGLIVWLGSLPKKIALKRNHPQVDAINACSWIGLALGGIGWPVAFVWALVNFHGRQVKPNCAPGERDSQQGTDPLTNTESQTVSESKRVTELKQRVEELEQKLQAATNQGDLA